MRISPWLTCRCRVPTPLSTTVTTSSAASVLRVSHRTRGPRTTGGTKISVLEAAVAAAVECLVPIRGARLTTAPAPPLAAREGPAVSSLRFPVPVPSRANLALEVKIDPSFTLDAWDRQALRQAARVVGLLIASRNQAVPLPPGQPPDPAERSSERAVRCAGAARDPARGGDRFHGPESKENAVPARNWWRARCIASVDGMAGPFVAVNCAALVETLLEAEAVRHRRPGRDRGAGPPRQVRAGRPGHLVPRRGRRPVAGAQAKLLRAIQELSVERVGGHGARSVDIRIVVARTSGSAVWCRPGGFAPISTIAWPASS